MWLAGACITASAQQCSTGRPATDLVFTIPSSLTISRDAPDGTVIYSSSQVAPNREVSADCRPRALWGVRNTAGPHPASGTLLPIANTGLSLRWHMKHVESRRDLDVAAIGEPSQFGMGPIFFHQHTYFNLQLVKTGPIASDAAVPAGLVATVDYGTLTMLYLRLSNPGMVAAPTCRVTTPAVTASLTPRGGVQARSFTGIGSTSTPVDFQLGLDCTGVAATISATFTDTSDPANRSDQLPLTANSTATGLKVQILHNDTPVRYGADSSIAGNPNQIRLGAVDGHVGAISFPFTARYIQSAPQVTTGSANSVATVTFSYQ